MRGLHQMAAIAAMLSTSHVSTYELAKAGDYSLFPTHRQRKGKGQNNRRGKGLRAKPKKRPNRLTISKRVRRKHRRAA